jgi:hypothetical protein
MARFVHNKPSFLTRFFPHFPATPAPVQNGHASVRHRLKLPSGASSRKMLCRWVELLAGRLQEIKMATVSSAKRCGI